MKLVYNVKDKPQMKQLIVFAIQQLLAIMAATLVVPVIVSGATGVPMSSAAALLGAGIGTLVYQLFTRFKSPVFLGSSFAFINSMIAAFSGGIAVGYLGMILGAVFAGLVYVVIALIIKLVGVKWIPKVMPSVVIGPTVAIIGLGLAGNAIGDLTKATAGGSPYLAILCGLVTLFVTMICSVYGKRMMKLIPFIMGILAGYVVAAIFTLIGNAAGVDALKIVDFSALINCFKPFSFSSIISVPEFTFVEALKIDALKAITVQDILTVAVAYVPVAFVVFAEHLADHRNLSTIIENDLLEDPGLDNTLLGDGVGSMAGAFFGGCPNTTYGESVGCVAITKNASVATITMAALLAIAIAFISPFVAFVNTIPSCVMGGVCMALYGFIAVSGLKMIQNVNLNANRNLFVVSIILIAGIGGMTVSIGQVTLTNVACALILGIIVNAMLSKAPETEE